MITILSPNANYRATLTDHDDGVWVAIRRISAGTARGQQGRQIHAEVIDAPFHVVADRMVDVLAELEATSDLTGPRASASEAVDASAARADTSKFR